MNETKQFTLRVPRNQWSFVKQKALDTGVSLNQLMIMLIQRYQERCKKRVDRNSEHDTMASDRLTNEGY